MWYHKSFDYSCTGLNKKRRFSNIQLNKSNYIRRKSIHHANKSLILCTPGPIQSNSILSEHSRMFRLRLISSRPSVSLEARKASLLLIGRDHTAAFWCVDRLQHGHHLIHLWPSVRVRVPASFHHMCEGARTAARYFRPQVLQFSK